MSRKKELLELCEDHKSEVIQLVDEICFMENQLIEIKKLPFYKVNPNNNFQQKVLPVAKLYKETLQQYTLSLKLFATLTGQTLDDEESPLRAWVKSRSSSVMDDIRNGEGLKPLC